MTHARLGVLSRWYCRSCTTKRHQGRFPCTDCCGWTATAGKALSGVLTVYGKKNARCLP